MKTVVVKYGRNGLTVNVPDDADVFEPAWVPAFPNGESAVRNALEKPYGSPPLRRLLDPGMKVAIAHTDLTRATPNAVLLPPILEEIKAAGVPEVNVTLINALGSHRKQTAGEMKALLGEKIYGTYRCLQHDAFDAESTVTVGDTPEGHPVRINRTFVEADFRITTGFIEPHFFAGFSGGGKLVLPGLADVGTISWNHRPSSIASRTATWGTTDGNPVWEEIHETARRLTPIFSVNVTLDGNGRINGVFTGELRASHAAGCARARAQSMFAVREPYDLVITGNSGYPLDQNLYQCVKGMSAAARIARPGGRILIAAACEDGLPDHGLYAELLGGAESVRDAYESIMRGTEIRQDQWQVQIQAMLLMRFDIGVFSEGLSEAQIRGAFFRPVPDIGKDIEEFLSQNPFARIAVLPEGPLSVGNAIGWEP